MISGKGNSNWAGKRRFWLTRHRGCGHVMETWRPGQRGRILSWKYLVFHFWPNAPFWRELQGSRGGRRHRHFPATFKSCFKRSLGGRGERRIGRGRVMSPEELSLRYDQSLKSLLSSGRPQPARWKERV